MDVLNTPSERCDTEMESPDEAMNPRRDNFAITQTTIEQSQNSQAAAITSTHEPIPKFDATAGTPQRGVGNSTIIASSEGTLDRSPDTSAINRTAFLQTPVNAKPEGLHSNGLPLSLEIKRGRDRAGYYPTPKSTPNSNDSIAEVICPFCKKQLTSAEVDLHQHIIALHSSASCSGSPHVCPPRDIGSQTGMTELCGCPKPCFFNDFSVLCNSCWKPTGWPTCLCLEPAYCKESKTCDVCWSCGNSTCARRVPNAHGLTPEDTSAIIADCKRRGYNENGIYEMFSNIRMRADYAFHDSELDRNRWIKEGILVKKGANEFAGQPPKPSDNGEVQERATTSKTSKPELYTEDVYEAANILLNMRFGRTHVNSMDRRASVVSLSDTIPLEDEALPPAERRTAIEERYRNTSATREEVPESRVAASEPKLHTFRNEVNKKQVTLSSEKKNIDDKTSHHLNGAIATERQFALLENKEKLKKQKEEALKVFSYPVSLPTAAQTHNPKSGGFPDQLMKMEPKTDEEYNDYFRSFWLGNAAQNKEREEAEEKKRAEEIREQVESGFPNARTQGRRKRKLNTEANESAISTPPRKTRSMQTNGRMGDVSLKGAPGSEIKKRNRTIEELAEEETMTASSSLKHAKYARLPGVAARQDTTPEAMSKTSVTSGEEFSWCEKSPDKTLNSKLGKAWEAQSLKRISKPRFDN